MPTPEYKTKKSINQIIAKYPEVYKFMPVPSGYGPSSLDYILCVNGLFVGIEAKAPGKKPSPRQDIIIEKIVDAGGKVFVIDGDHSQLLELDSYLHDRSTGKPEA